MTIPELGENFPPFSQILRPFWDIWCEILRPLRRHWF
jgi:hypothetical protein